jgi:hypothetical protein
MQGTERIRQLSTRELALFGIEDVAYIKPVETDGGVAYAAHAADGTPIAVAASRELAFATARRHELEPLSVH